MKREAVSKLDIAFFQICSYPLKEHFQIFNSQGQADSKNSLILVIS
jgi:hypothetical protein